MTVWRYNELLAHAEEKVNDRILEGVGLDALHVIEDAFDGLRLGAFEIVHVIAPTVSVFGRGSQPGIED